MLRFTAFTDTLLRDLGCFLVGDAPRPAAFSGEALRSSLNTFAKNR
jgi:hypothetical protein